MNHVEAMYKHYYLKEFTDKLESKDPDAIAVIKQEMNSLELKKQWLEELLNSKADEEKK